MSKPSGIDQQLDRATLLSRPRVARIVGAILERRVTDQGSSTHSLVTRLLAEDFGATFALTGRLHGLPRCVTTRSVWAAGEYLDPMTYDLTGTPCERVVDREPCSFASGLCELFPRDELLVTMKAEAYLGAPIFDLNAQPIGLVAVIDQKERGWNSEDRGLLTMVADALAPYLESEIAIEKAEVAHREAVRASGAKTRFLASMSHELRTPLNGVLASVSLLRDSQMSEEQRELLELAEGSGRMLLGLIGDVLDLSKVESGKFRLDETRTAIEAWARDLRGLFEVLANERNLGLNFVTDWCDSNVLMDSSRVRQVAVNLINNALKYTPSGRVEAKMVLRDEGRARHLRIEVHDTGPGVAESERARIFNSFEQVDSNSEVTEGVGLGLSICKLLIDAMNGDIGVTDSPLGGACFWFQIPVRRTEPDASLRLPGATAAEESSAGPSAPCVAKILVAEDNATNRRIAERMLERLGHEFVAAENGLEAIEQMRDESIDLVLMDCQMPELDGWEATKQLRAAGEARPIIAMTANAFAEDRDRCLRVGMDDYLAKPVSLEYLRAMIETWMAKSRALNSI